MCGIAGWYLPKCTEGVKPNPDDLRRILQHRGPDGHGSFVDGPVGLVHTRLAIIDPVGGQQPLYSDDGQLALVANGEIYNHVELRGTLAARGYRFTTHSDCEPLLYAYREYGDDFLQHVEGMFAFALYDRSRSRLLLGRDRLGIKPLFLLLLHDAVYFASEMKALFPVFDGRPKIDPIGLAQYLQTGFTCGTNTVVQGITRVSPGELLVITAEGINRSRYWDLRRNMNSLSSLPATEEYFTDLIDLVMRQHIRSDVPYGLFLSGGVDSSVLLALLSRYTQEPIRTYSVGFASHGVPNELPAARALSERFGTIHTEIHLDKHALLRRLPFAVWSADELISDYANLPTSMLAERASADLKVVFSGEGGDEVFAGYGRYRTPAIQRCLRALGSPGTGGFRTRGIFDRVRHLHIFKQEINECLHDWRAPLVAAWGSTPRKWTTLQRMQYVDLVTWLPDDLLAKVDHMLMSWGMEGRVPFLDHRVVEFGLMLEDNLKVHRRSGKVFLKRWGTRILPGHDIWSRKRGFTVPIREWLRGDTLDRVERTLLASPTVCDWCHPAGITRLLAAQREQPRFSFPIWLLLHLAIWGHLFLEQKGPAAPEPDQDPFIPGA
ncbi:asparagine synthetase [glutamine-hydrolyzing] 1 [bacterium BMS3Bbin13]|nr:asparagine synthetase [glutamine-hydrolyzing] 1 [bacterium BMS3Bbin13]